MGTTREAILSRPAAIAALLILAVTASAVPGGIAGTATSVRSDNAGSILLARSDGPARPASTDTTPPLINLFPLPAVTDEPAVDVRGTVSDASPCNVTVNGIGAMAASTGVFIARVPLSPGNNTITVRAVDAAGNEALALAYVEFVPPERWYAHPVKHFRIPVPYGWHGYANFTQDGVPVDVYMYTADLDANLIVVSESRRLQGTQAEARAILSEATDNLSAWPGFRFLSHAIVRTIDGHDAATAFVAWQPANETVYQVITIVLGPEYAMFWAIIGTMTPAAAPRAAPLVNETTAAFDVLLPDSVGIARWSSQLLLVAVLATAVEGGYFGYRVLRGRRRLPWDRAYL